MLLRMAQPQPRVARLAALVGALLVAAAMGGACTRQPIAEETSAVRISARLMPPQPTVGPATLSVSLSGATAATLGNAKVGVVAHVTHPGMTPIVATVTQHGPDVYDAAVDFTMAGDWMLIAAVQLPDGRRLESRVPVKVLPRQP
jgi:YtkA-like protein